MLLLESFVHRDRLAGIIGRWMVDRPRPGDVADLKRIVNFNLYISRIWGDHLANYLLRELYSGVAPRWNSIRTKGQLKDFAVEHLTLTNPRVEEMCARYRRFPEDFYREAPIDGGFYSVMAGDAPRLVGSLRIKRFRRIAEKGARRIIDFMLQRIRASADALADERARAIGVQRAQLTTPPEVMHEEFLHAERRVIKSIKQGSIHSELPVLSIPDVVGMKLIEEDQAFPRLLEALERNGDCQVVELERHTGQYNAVNVQVHYTLPKALLLANPPSGRYLEVLRFRGLDADEVPRLYQEFLELAEPTACVEIIVTTFQEFLESEIGRGMHEERVLQQRAHPDYRGHLSTNVRYLLDFILGLCRSPWRGELDEVPVKLWVHYMPDTYEQIVRRLYLADELFFDKLEDDPIER